MSEKESSKQTTRNKQNTKTSSNDKQTTVTATLNNLIQAGGFAVWDHTEEYPVMQTNSAQQESKESPLKVSVNKQKQAANQTNNNEAFRMTVGERVQMLVNDSNIRNKIYELVSTGQLRISAPILRLDILADPTKDFELDKDDLADVFARYGEVIDVIIKPPTKAYIVFRDIVSAVFAKKCLNGYYLNELDINLRISYLDLPEAPAIPAKHYHELIEYYEMMTGRGDASAGLRMYYPNTAELSDMTPNSAASQPWMNKLTCRYEIQIDNDKEFQVARKIIGSKGCNMKRIIDLCNKQFKSERGNNGEIVKLRLRGRGSGFKEGPEKLESQDPLHLCISAKSKEVYDMACHLVEELLNNIYEEYRKFCYSRGRNVKLAPAMKKIETFPWNKSSNPEGFYSSEQTINTPTSQHVVMGYATPSNSNNNQNQNVIGSGKRNY